MSDRQPYSRVYWSIRSDPKFVGIYGNDSHLAAWLRLLIAADATWPAPADVPVNAKRASVAALAACGLIDLHGDGMFTVHGLNAERGRRRDAAAFGAGQRWHSERNANALPSDAGRIRTPDASRAKTRRDEVSRDEPPARDGFPNLDRDAIRLLEERTGRPWSLAGDKQLAEYDRLIGDHGLPAVAAAFDSLTQQLEREGRTAGQPLTARQLIWPTMKILEPMPTPERVSVHEVEADKRSDRIFDRMQDRRLEWFRNTGKWDEAWGPQPESVA